MTRMRATRGNGRLHILNALLLGALFGVSLAVFPELPARIPAHFDGSGAVTRWETRSLAGWLLVPLIALGTVALTYGSAALLPGRPALFNHPDREAFLALPSERRGPVIVRMQRFLYGISSFVLVLFGLVQWMRWQTALGADAKGYVALTLVVGFMIGPVAMGLWLPGIGREIREQAAESTREASSAAGDGVRG